MQITISKPLNIYIKTRSQASFINERAYFLYFPSAQIHRHSWTFLSLKLDASLALVWRSEMI